jgi:hypothetical protein
MQHDLSVLTRPSADRASLAPQVGVVQRSIRWIIVGAVVVFLAFYNLTDYPTTWFDEGSHLHVPKTLVRFGTYADYSSEGFRYYGPTVGVGPTVMLPIAAAFQIFGIGLLQARLVMVLYFLAAIYAFYRLAHVLGGDRLAWVATALLVASRGVGLVEYGREVLGEVPAFFFVVVGLAVWFAAWEKASWPRLVAVGLLLGLATVTKNQFLLVLAPTLGIAWLLNLIYYRTTPQRVFVVPGLVAGTLFALWQVYTVMYLGPSTASANWAALRTATAGAALVFSPELMKRGLGELMSFKVYLGWLLPILLYAFVLVLPRRREDQQWGLLFVLIAVNLAWYVIASISWLRYAFLGLAVASLFVARFFSALTDGFQVQAASMWQALRGGESAWPKHALRLIMLAWLAVMIALPLAQTAWNIISPDFNAPSAMATYLNQYVSRDALIETWEPEMGFLTDHNYHFPPPLLLNDAVGYIWLGKPSPSQQYSFVQDQAPDYVLVGAFAQWVKLYPDDILSAQYKLMKTIGGYELYARSQ